MKFDGLKTQDYYAMQGLSFLIVLVSQIKHVYMQRLRSSSIKSVRKLSLQESIVKGGYIKIAKHPNNKWYVCTLSNSAVDLLVEMGVNIENDVNALNKGMF